MEISLRVSLDLNQKKITKHTHSDRIDHNLRRNNNNHIRKFIEMQFKNI